MRKEQPPGFAKAAAPLGCCFFYYLKKAKVCSVWQAGRKVFFPLADGWEQSRREKPLSVRSACTFLFLFLCQRLADICASRRSRWWREIEPILSGLNAFGRVLSKQDGIDFFTAAPRSPLSPSLSLSLSLALSLSHSLSHTHTHTHTIVLSTR